MHYKEQLLHKERSSVLEEEDIQELIINRDISPEDHNIIEKLSELPKSIFLEFHNFFSSERDRLTSTLKQMLENINNENTERKKYLTLFLNLSEKYNWTVCWNTNVVFERRKNQNPIFIK
jgi:hypothetical protein